MFKMKHDDKRRSHSAAREHARQETQTERDEDDVETVRSVTVSAEHELARRTLAQLQLTSLSNQVIYDLPYTFRNRAQMPIEKRALQIVDVHLRILKISGTCCCDGTQALLGKHFEE